MRHKHKTADEEANVDMTPMLDIVFIMLIFFIVTTSFTKEARIDANRPKENQQQTQSETKNIFIEIRASGDIIFDNRRIDVERVLANVQSRLAEQPTDAMVIQAHQEVEHCLVVRVMNQGKEAGISNITVTAPE